MEQRGIKEIKKILDLSLLFLDYFCINYFRSQYLLNNKCFFDVLFINGFIIFPLGLFQFS